MYIIVKIMKERSGVTLKITVIKGVKNPKEDFNAITAWGGCVKILTGG